MQTTAIDSIHSNHINRRHFLRVTSAATAFAAVAPFAARGKVLGANEKISVGVIGCGPQGLGVMGNFLNQDTCRVVAVCDVKQDQLETAKNHVNGHYNSQDCRTYHDFRELVERRDIDACLIATPDHWHVLAALAAVESGKDVYVEKPLARSLDERHALRKALKKHKRIFQFGTQQRSDRTFRLACELVRNGCVGKLQQINVWAPGSAPAGSLKQVPPPPGVDYDFWLGPVSFRPFTENLCSADGAKKTWWFISDFALGFVSGWGIHPMDIANWGGADLLNGQVTVEGRGNFRMAEGICDTATIWEVDYTFASGVKLKFVGTPNGRNVAATTDEPFLHGDEWKERYRNITTHGTAFEGSDGWVHVCRGAITMQPEELIDIKPDTFTVKLPRSSNHTRNFLDCVKSREQTICPIDAAIKADNLCQIADIAMRLGRKVTFDLDKERFVNDDAANHRLKAAPMRKPWHV